MSLQNRASPRSNLACPRCDQPVDVRSPHVVVSGSAIRVYCSDACLQGTTVTTVIEDAPAPDEPPRRKRWWITAGFVVGSTCIALTYVTQCEDGTSPATETFAFVPPPPPAPPAVHRAVPPSHADEVRRADDTLLAELAHDAWIHPLAGPKRLMPTAPIHTFGAARAVDPPPECLSGHCGVDIGVGVDGIWGQPVHAVHDGVIAWVDRGPNEDYGGIYVKIEHRDGGLFSWYFHLAAVPRWVRPGVKVRLGQVIGLVGDTGLRQPVPHLHFAMSVKPPKATRERYLDPEPLIAIWPVWMPEAGSAAVSTQAPPGMPVRVHDGPRPRRPAPVSTGSAAAALPLASGPGSSELPAGSDAPLN